MRDIHKRVGTAMLFESSGGMVEKVAHLPELRFALGEPDVDTASIDSAAAALEQTGFFVRRAGTDGYRIHHQATLRKAVADLRASLDEENEVKPAIRRLVEREFNKGNGIPKAFFPKDSSEVSDVPRMTLVVMSPDLEWRENNHTPEQIAQWTKKRGGSDRLHPAALVWCTRKPGRDLEDRVEAWLAWQKVRSEIDAGTLGPEFEKPDLDALSQQVRNAENHAMEEVWASYRFVSLYDSQTESKIRTIDLGAGYATGNESLTGRVIASLKQNGLLNDSVGAGYIERNWPPALRDSGAWPLSSLRQSFMNGALTRLLDPDQVLRQKILEFVEAGEFGLASGNPDQGQGARAWYKESAPADDVTFDSNTYLLTKQRAEQIKAPPEPTPNPRPEPEPQPSLDPGPEPAPHGGQQPLPTPQKATLRLAGKVPMESWNMVGVKLLTKLRSEEGLSIRVDLSVSVASDRLKGLEDEVRQALADLKLEGQVNMTTDQSG